MEDRYEDAKTAAFAILAPGAKIAHYQLVRQLGVGGMGEVFWPMTPVSNAR